MEALQIGSLVGGKYRLEREIGKGAMGVVFEATQDALSRTVAVKIMNPEFAAKPTSRARFSREARVAAALQHPNAVRVLDFGEDSGVLFLAMELLEGAPLRKFVDREKQLLELERIFQIAIPVADVLAAAHDIQLVHRDIKPENIFLLLKDDKLIDVRVVDFGLAFISEEDGSLGRLTQEGVLGGTPVYMSPEQAQGEALTPAADVYSFGCMLYEMLCGEPPFSGSVAQTLTRHMYMPPTPLADRQLKTEVPAELDELILAMLAKSPALRPSASTVASQLRELARTPPDKRRRSRDASFLKEREHRMVGASKPLAAKPTETTAVKIAVVGPMDAELATALAANSISAVAVESGSAIADDFDAVYLVAGSVQAVEGLGTQKPIITDVSSSELKELAKYVRAGASELVVRPVRADELARKIRRSIRLRRRRSSDT